MLRIRSSFVLALALCPTACATFDRAAAPASPELALLESAAAQPDAAPFTLLALYAQLAASRRDRDGLAVFEARARAQPEDGLTLALAAVFAVRTAGDVPLVKRIGHVERALARLDRAVELDPGIPRMLRGVVLAELPKLFHAAPRAIEDLQWALAQPSFPYGLRRGMHRGLAKAYDTLGRDDESRAELRRAGLASLDPDLAQPSSDLWIDPTNGIRFGAPRIVERGEGVWSAEGFGFSTIGFVATDDGVVAIDAGTSPADAKAALAAFAEIDPRPPSRIILTHAHYDHLEGLPAFAREGLEIIAHADYRVELAVQHATAVVAPRVLGPLSPQELALSPTRVVAKDETIEIGGTRFELHPLHGGETLDTLIVHVPQRGVVFVGDALMPYVGAPFFPEGSPEGMIEAIAHLRSLPKAVLVHGHTPLTERWTHASMAGLQGALVATRTRVLDGIAHGTPLAKLLADDPLPKALIGQPLAVIPYVATRRHFIRRLYLQHTGPWQLLGIVDIAPADRALALDALAGHRVGAFVRAAEHANEQGRFAVALELADAGLAGHGKHARLARARSFALARLRELSDQTDPFTYLAFTEAAGATVPPVD